MPIYIIETTFDSTRMRFDGAQASAPIHYENPDGEWEPTPFQTADARHDETEAAVLVIGYFGRDYWCSPDDDPEDEDEYIRDLIVSVEADEDAEDESD